MLRSCIVEIGPAPIEICNYRRPARDQCCDSCFFLCDVMIDLGELQTHPTDVFQALEFGVDLAL